MIDFSNKIIAHRGESYLAPENSLSAISQAWYRGAKAVEVDVHLTADNEVVVIHDKHTGRVGDKKLSISKSTLNELQTVDIGIKKSVDFKGEQIPTLEQVLHTVPDHGKLIIEIKCGSEIIAPLINNLENAPVDDKQIEIICFNIEVISELKKVAPTYKMLWLLNLDYYLPRWLLRINTNNIIKTIEEHNLDGINVWAGKTIHKQFVNDLKKEGYNVYCWTVDNPVKALALLYYGIDAITTNKAEWMVKQLNKVIL